MNNAVKILSGLIMLARMADRFAVNADELQTQTVEQRCEEYFRCYGIPCLPIELAGRPRIAGIYWESDKLFVVRRDDKDGFPDIPSVEISTADPSVFLYPKFPFSVFGGPLESERVASVEPPKLSPDSTVFPDALVGPRQLRFLQLQMDAHARTFRLATSLSLPNRSESVQLKLAGLTVQVPLTFDVWGTREFKMDLSIPSTILLTRETADQLQRMRQLAPLRPELTETKEQISGKKTSYILRKMQFGSIVFENIPVEISATSNQIGVGIFRFVNMRLDFPEQKVYFWRNDDETAPIQIRPLTHVIFPEYVTPDYLRVRTISDRFNHCDLLQRGDRILEIQGKPAVHLSFWEILESLRRSEGTLPMKIERNGEVIHIELPMTPDFSYPPKWPEPVLEFDPEN
jgi:hypothetical protein